MSVLGVQALVKVGFGSPRLEVYVRDVLAVTAGEDERSRGNESRVTVFASYFGGDQRLSKRRVTAGEQEGRNSR